MFRLVFTGSIPILHTNLWFQKHQKPTSGYAVMTTWQMLEDRGGLSTTLAVKGCVLTTHQERSSKWIHPSEWWWREERWTSRESLWLPAIGTWRYPFRAYKWLGAISMMFPVCMAPRPYSSISLEFLNSIIIRPMNPLGCWNLVNPLLSMNETWMNECAARLQPLVDQYKPIQHQTFPIEKFQDLIVTTQSYGDKKISFKNS